MLATVIVQFRASTFLAHQLAELQRRPPCPPLAQFGIQLQRVRVTQVSLRQSEPKDFDIFTRDAFGDRVANDFPAQGRQTQLVLDLDLSVTTTDAIAASPGALTADGVALTPRLVCDLTGFVPPGPGIALRVETRALEWPPGSLPALPPTPVPMPVHLIQQAIEDEVLQHVPNVTRRLDPEGQLHGGREAVNAGIAAHESLEFLELRSEASPGNDYNHVRWTYFHQGQLADRLHGEDWALYFRGSDIALTMTLMVEGLLKQVLTTPEARFKQCWTDYEAGGDVARFRTTVVLRVDVPMVPPFDKQVPVVTTISLDPGGAGLVVDLWLQGLEELVDDVIGFARVAVSFLPPALALPLQFAIGEGVSAGEELLQGLEVPPQDGITFTRPGPYSVRGVIALPAPADLVGPGASIRQLATDAGGFSLAGAWPASALTPSTVEIRCEGYEWRGPQFSCAAASRNIVADFANDPYAYLQLTAVIELSQAGSEPIELCSASIVEAPEDLAYPLSLAPVLAGRLPRAVALRASGRWAWRHPGDPVTIELRTTAGVLRVTVPPAGELRPEQLRALAGAIEVKLLACERVLPEWFGGGWGGGRKFELDWIDDPLIDPERLGSDPVIAGARFERWSVHVTGMPSETTVLLAGEDQARWETAVTDASGAAALTLVLPGGQLPSLSAQAPLRARSTNPVQRSAPDASAPGLEVSRQAMHRVARIRLDRPVRMAVGSASLGAQGYLVLVDDGAVLEVDLSAMHRSAIVQRRLAPGARELVATALGTVVFGDCGALLHRTGGAALLLGATCLGVRGAACIGRELFVLRAGVIECRGGDDGCLRWSMPTDATAMTQFDGRLLLASPRGLMLHDGVDHGCAAPLPVALPGTVDLLRSLGDRVLARGEDRQWWRIDVQRRSAHRIAPDAEALRFAANARSALHYAPGASAVDVYRPGEVASLCPVPAEGVHRPDDSGTGVR